MSEWWTYSLSDFLLFSPRTYHRLFELYNEAVWPAHVAAVALAIAIAISLRRNDGRTVAAILAATWLWIAWAYHLDRYATINWTAVYFAAAFAFQSLLLLWTGVVRNALDLSSRLRIGLALVAFALVIQPTIALLLGRPWTQSEIFGLAPDPTAIATLGILVMARRPHWHLLTIPILWCIFTGLTLWTMEEPDALVSPIAATLALAVAAWKTLAPLREPRDENH
ncbi:MAG: DUF6064 family protein [Alphaproteobacteria bacterium]|nr:DUF6064 family protein [Alphaproteobacteria bacterium]